MVLMKRIIRNQAALKISQIRSREHPEKKPETKPASGSTVKKTIKTKSLKVKKTKVTLKKGKKYKIQAKKIPASSTAKIMYRSSNKRIAKVTKKVLLRP